MSGTLTFGGHAASEFGMRIGGVNVYSASGNNAQMFSVPGLIGEVFPDEADVVVPNEIREYSAAIYLRNASAAAVEARMNQIRSWLLDYAGYVQLTDSYEPSFYRKACFVGSFAPIRKGAGSNFQVPLSFSCNPKRFIANAPDFVMGTSETVTEVTPYAVSGYSINKNAKPLIKISNTGGNNPAFLIRFRPFNSIDPSEEYGSISVAANIPSTETIYFDAETLNATDGNGRNRNQYILDVTGDIFLPPSRSIVQKTATGAKVTITPRWWVR